MMYCGRHDWGPILASALQTQPLKFWQILMDIMEDELYIQALSERPSIGCSAVQSRAQTNYNV